MLKKNTKILTLCAMFIALDIIAARFLVIQTGLLRFDFQTVVGVLCGAFLGPVWGAVSLGVSDLLGATLNTGGMVFFFGYTLSAVLRGVISGSILKSKFSSLRIIITLILVFVLCDMFLSTVWLSIINSTPFVPLLISRIFPKSILLLVDCILMFSLSKVIPGLKRQFFN